MNIRNQLQRENSRRNADQIEYAVAASEEKRVELMACFFSDEPTLVKRSAMVVGNLGRHHPELLRPWWKDLQQLLSTTTQPAVRRCITRYFSELPLPLPQRMEKELIDRCLALLADPKVKVATAVFSMQFIADRAEQFPQQAAELKQLIRERLPSGSAGFRSRGQKVLEQLEVG